MRQRNDFSPSTMGVTFAKLDHPIVAELYEDATAEAGGVTETPVLDLLELDLRDLGQALPSDLRQRLRLDDQATKVMFELHVGAGFVRLGHEPSWLPDRGQKRPEMILNPGSSSPLSVECKRRDGLDGFEQAANQFWKHLQYALRERMTQSQLNYWVKVTAQEFRLGDVDRVVKEAVALMRSVERGSTVVTENRYRIDCVQLAEPGGAIPWELFKLFPRGMLGVNSGRAQRSQVRTPRFAGDDFAQGRVTDPFALRLELIDDPERRVRGVLRNLKNASKQVRLGLPSVVYIDVNLGSFERESAEFEDMLAAVAAELQTTHTRVSAVVLVNAHPSQSMDGRIGWWVRTEFLPQPRPQHPLPAHLALPGHGLGSRWLPGRWLEVT